ncbi:MAG: hypothetical protein QW156_04020 [Candidatus Aenigmatarchaeota archaeon]
MSFYLGYEQSYGNASNVYQFHPSTFEIIENDTFIEPFFKHDLFLPTHNNIRSSMRKFVNVKFRLHSIEGLMYILRSLLRWVSYSANTHTFNLKNVSNITTLTILTNMGYDIQKCLIKNMRLNFNAYTNLTIDVDGEGFYSQLNPTQTSRNIEPITSLSSSIFTLGTNSMSPININIDITQTTSHNFILQNVSLENDKLLSHGKSHIKYSVICTMDLTKYNNLITNTKDNLILQLGNTTQGLKISGQSVYNIDVMYKNKSNVVATISGYMIDQATNVYLYSAYGMLP